ncbi:hypothetical protein QYM36_017585, partial [Artemia franciscana]
LVYMLFDQIIEELFPELFEKPVTTYHVRTHSSDFRLHSNGEEKKRHSMTPGGDMIYDLAVKAILEMVIHIERTIIFCMKTCDKYITF